MPAPPCATDSPPNSPKKLSAASCITKPSPSRRSRQVDVSTCRPGCHPAALRTRSTSASNRFTPRSSCQKVQIEVASRYLQLSQGPTETPCLGCPTSPRIKNAAASVPFGFHLVVQSFRKTDRQSTLTVSSTPPSVPAPVPTTSKAVPAMLADHYLVIHGLLTAAQIASPSDPQAAQWREHAAHTAAQALAALLADDGMTAMMEHMSAEDWSSAQWPPTLVEAFLRTEADLVHLAGLPSEHARDLVHAAWNARAARRHPPVTGTAVLRELIRIREALATHESGAPTQPDPQDIPLPPGVPPARGAHKPMEMAQHQGTATADGGGRNTGHHRQPGSCRTSGGSGGRRTRRCRCRSVSQHGNFADLHRLATCHIAAGVASEGMRRSAGGGRCSTAAPSRRR